MRATIAHVRSILPQVEPPGGGLRLLAEAPTCTPRTCAASGLTTHFDVVRRADGLHFPVTVNLPGVHNVLNSLAAIAVALEIGVTQEAIQRALGEFPGHRPAPRRTWPTSNYSTSAGDAVTIVDDYGHHPTEIAATLDAVRQGYAGPARGAGLPAAPLHAHARPARRLRHACCPARDALLVTEVYAAGEAPIAGGRRPRHLPRRPQRAARSSRCSSRRSKTLHEALRAVLKPGDVLLTMGAGCISAVSHALPGS